MSYYKKFTQIDFRIALNFFTILTIFSLGFGYWVYMMIRYPGVETEALFSFRPWGDFTYQPFFQQAINFTYLDLNEQIKGIESQDIESSLRLAFPVMSVWFHSLLYLLNSNYGLILSDFILIGLNFFVFRAIFQFFFENRLVALILSLSIVGFLFNYLSAILFQILHYFTFGQLILYLIFIFVFCFALLSFFNINLRNKMKLLIFYSSVFVFFLLQWAVHDGAFVFFQLRYPRPLITESFLFLSFLFLLWSQRGYFSKVFKTRRVFLSSLLGGICLGIGGLGNVHSLMIFMLVYFFWFVFDLCFELSVNFKKLYIWSGLALGFFLVFGGNLIWQGVARSDLVSRLGVFDARSLSLLYLDSPHIILSYLGLSLILFVLLNADKISFLRVCISQNGHGLKEFRLGLFGLIFLLNGSFFALPIQQIILGKLTSIYHFRDRYWYFFIFIMICVVTHLTKGLIVSFRRLNYLKTHQTFFCMIISILCLCSSFVAVKRVISRTEHPRDPTLIVTNKYADRYRDAFFQLTKWFVTEVGGDFQGQTLASFDPLVFSWWRIHASSKSFNVDPFASALTISEIRRRFVYFCVLAGMSYSDFIKFIELFYVKVFWVGSLGISPIESIIAKDFSKYREEDQSLLKTYTIFDDWELTYKIADYNELEGMFRTFHNLMVNNTMLSEENFWNLADPLYIVLLNTDDQLHLNPPESRYKNIFVNDVFRVFKLLQ